MQRPSIYAGVLAGATALAALSFAQPAPDHLACYHVKDSAKKGKFTLTLHNAGVTESCTVRLPARLGCLASAKSDIVPTPPGGGPSGSAAGSFLCYPLKCPHPFPPGAETTDQFGGKRVVRLRGAALLCAPATRGAETVGPSTTTTTVPGPCDFSSATHRCEGTCGNGGHCSAVASGGACECRTTSCGNADQPECNGFCNSDEACIFTVTGCSCTSIP